MYFCTHFSKILHLLQLALLNIMHKLNIWNALKQYQQASRICSWVQCTLKKKLVWVVSIASSLKYRPMKCCCPHGVCNHPYASAAACRCIFKTAVACMAARNCPTWFLDIKLLVSLTCAPCPCYKRVCISVQVTSAEQWLHIHGIIWWMCSLCRI